MNLIKDTIEYIRQLLTFWIEVMPWERGIRVTLGKKTKELGPGIWIKLPILHRIYIQSIRIRIITTPVQTITNSKGEAVTIRMAIGYEIKNIRRLFNSIQQPVETISNIAEGCASKCILIEDAGPQKIESDVMKVLNQTEYGISFPYVKVTTYARVRTYRLIGDHNWANSDGEVITIKS